MGRTKYRGARRASVVRQVTRPVAAPAAVPAPSPVAAPFVLKASRTHVEVRATHKALGMRELLQVMASDPNLRGCAIERCGFDGEMFSATLRIERSA